MSRGEFMRALLEEFNKLSSEEQDRILAHKAYRQAIKLARGEERDLRMVTARKVTAKSRKGRGK